MHPSRSIAIATLVIAPLFIQTEPTGSKPVHYDFTVTVTAGSLAGNTYHGSFHYDDAALTGVGEETIDQDDDLRVTMTFFGNEYTESADIDYPTFPQLILENGEVQRLDFWIEPGERGSWWDRPGWQVNLSPQEPD